MPETMDALVLHAIGDLRREEIAKPSVKQGCALVRVGWCGICGSDLPRVYHHGTYSFPLVCGHEFSGVIDVVGEGVTGFKAGDRVAVFPLLWCGKCSACEQGRYVMCLNYDYLGSRSNGAFAEYVVAPEANLVRVPDNVSLAEAAMTEPAAVALHAVKRGGGATVGETAAILGAGPIGLMAAQWARAMGASQVLLFDVREQALELARALGFTQVFNSREVDAVATIESLTGGNGAHLCLEAAGVPPTMQAALKATRRGGRCVLMGNPGGDVTLPAKLISQCMRREIDIFGTWNSDYSAAGNDDDWRTVLESVSKGLLDLKPLITHKVELDRGIGAFEMMRDNSEFFAKVMIGKETMK